MMGSFETQARGKRVRVAIRHAGIFVASALALTSCAESLEGPEPTISAASNPAFVCNEQLTTRVALAGDGFSPLPIQTAEGPSQLVLPALTLTRTADLDGAADGATMVAIPDDPAAPADSSVQWQSQQSMTFDVSPGLNLAEGVYSLGVENGNGSATSSDAWLVAVPPPVLDSIEPMAICIAQGAVTLQISGSNFLDAPAATPSLPSVTFESSSDSLTLVVDSVSDCVELPAPAVGVRRCANMVVTVPEAALPPDVYDVTITNPETAACSSSEAVTIEFVPPPELNSVNPTQICAGGGTLGFAGANIRPGATLSIGDVGAGSTNVDAGGTSGTAVFGPGLNPGTHDVTIENIEGCSDTLTAAVTVVDGPIIFWADPPTVFNGISTQITIYVSGVDIGVDRVSLSQAGGTPTDLDFSFELARGRIQAVVPVSTAPGVYDVSISADGCGASLPGAITVTDTLSVTVTSVDGAFGETASSTAVTIGGGGFVSTPRAYLNPDNPTTTTVASEIRSLSFDDATSLTGVVPSGLPAGLYDVVVVNPSGEVGLLEGGFTVTADPPPILEIVLPGEVDNGSVQNLEVIGTGLANAESVGWTCRDLTGVETTPSGTLVGSTAGTADVTLDSTSLAAGNTCVLRVTNTDGSYGDYSAVAVTAPASNLTPTSSTTDLTVGRRALALVNGRATERARYLYAIGGDAGSAASAYSSSESARVDTFGELGTWTSQRYPLPGPITLADAKRHGRFIYLIGGHDGTDELDTAYRAEVLRPEDSPTVVDINAERGGGAGLGAGLWTYRVAAVFPSTDARNPNGETLPSDPLVINLPPGLPDTLLMTIIWSPIPGAESYRVYRSPTAGDSDVQLVASVDAAATQYQDDGSAPVSTDVPLPLGSHGQWAALPSMSSPRAGVGIEIAMDPSDPAISYLYALGGADAAGAPVASYEFLTITTDSDGLQTIGSAWTAGTESIGDARWEHAVFLADSLTTPDAVTAGQSYIYVVGGKGATQLLSSAGAALVSAGGQLAAFTSVSALSPRSAGFAHISGNGFLYVFGGGDSPTRNSAISGEVCVPGVCTTPDVSNWNNQGFNLTSERYLADGVAESAQLFIVGGTADGTTALATTEATLW